MSMVFAEKLEPRSDMIRRLSANNCWAVKRHVPVLWYVLWVKSVRFLHLVLCSAVRYAQHGTRCGERCVFKLFVHLLTYLPSRPGVY